MNDKVNDKPKKPRRQDTEEAPFDPIGTDRFPLPHTGKGASVQIPGRPPSDLNWQAQRDTNASLTKQAAWEPSELQERIKSRFYRRLEESVHTVDRDTVIRDPALLEEFAGTSKIHTWIKTEAFLDWFTDENYFVDMMFALRGKAIKRLSGIIDDPVAMDADAIKAIKMVLEQTNPKKNEVRFIDETLNNMPPEQVRAEQLKLKAALGEIDE